MNIYKMGLALAGLLCLTLTPTLNADVWNQKTKVTFSEPVQLPGEVLPAGTYTFSLLGSKSNRNIVRISNADGTETYATILAIADKRLKPTGKTVIKFSETPPGDPMALRAWFFPGDVYGHEFVYPHDEAVKLAKANNQSVIVHQFRFDSLHERTIQIRKGSRCKDDEECPSQICSAYRARIRHSR